MLSQASTAKRLLKGMQPYRERPSKDRRKRFWVSNIYGDSSVPDSHDVCTYQFWAIIPQNRMIAKAKCFVLEQIVSLFHLWVLYDSGKKSNRNIQVTLELFKYDEIDDRYSRSGRSSLVNASSLLIANDSELLTVGLDSELIFHFQDCDCLQGYLPYHEGIDIERRQPDEINEADEPQIDENDDPYMYS